MKPMGNAHNDRDVLAKILAFDVKTLEHIPKGHSTSNVSRTALSNRQAAMCACRYSQSHKFDRRGCRVGHEARRSVARRKGRTFLARLETVPIQAAGYRMTASRATTGRSHKLFQCND
jgi:hypothetical protein